MYIAGERAEGVRNKEFLNSPASARSAFDTTRNAFALALRSYPFAQVFAKFDDDSYVYTRELIRKIGMDVNSTADVARYWGYPMVFESGFQFGSGGAGYVLNRRAAKILQECSVPGEFAAYEDASVGFCMFAAGIPLTDLVGLHPHHPYQMIRWDKYGHPSDRIHRREPLEGYMNPLSYHYMLPHEMIMMHDDIHLHGFPLVRSNPSIPKRIHQFWEGGTDRKPMFWLQKCKEVHADWEYTLWDNELIKRRFPSGDSVVGVLNYDGESGRPANDDFYARSTEKNEWSDIMRYEILLFHGGLYLDADTECFRSVEDLVSENLGVVQAFGFLEKDESYLGGLIASGVIGTYPFSPLSVVLVSELQNTDWTQPPWISAGPMHFTKIIRSFQNYSDRIPSYWDILVLDSVHVYPYHHSDKQPSNLYHALMQKGAVMDQKWGTTHGTYKHDSWRAPGDSVSRLLLEPAQEGSFMENYINQVHQVGLSTLARSRPRWVIALVSPDTDACGVLSHLVSCMIFAIATGRVLMVDGYNSQARWNPVFRLETQTLERFGFTGENLPQRGISVQGQQGFLSALEWSDLDSQYSDSVLHIMDEGYGLWGAHVLSNMLYQNFVFRNMPVQEIITDLNLSLAVETGNVDCGLALSYNSSTPASLSAPTLVFVYVTLGYNETRIQEFQRSLMAVYDRFVQLGTSYSFILFVDQTFKWQYLQFIISSRVNLVQSDGVCSGVSPADCLLHPAVTRFDRAFLLSGSPRTDLVIVERAVTGLSTVAL